MQTVANQATGNQSRLFPGENASDPSIQRCPGSCFNRHRLEAVKLNLTSSLCILAAVRNESRGWTGFESSGWAICRLRHYPRISSHQIPFQGFEQGSLNLIRQAWVYKGGPSGCDNNKSKIISDIANLSLYIWHTHGGQNNGTQK
jgi:hypothetical protein